MSGGGRLFLSLSLFLNISTIALRALAIASGLLWSGHLNHRCSLEPQPQHRMGSLVLAACWRACSAMLAQMVHCRMQRSATLSGGASGTETVGVLARTDERCSWSVGWRSSKSSRSIGGYVRSIDVGSSKRSMGWRTEAMAARP